MSTRCSSNSRRKRGHRSVHQLKATPRFRLSLQKLGPNFFEDRESVVEGKRVDLGGRRIIKKKKETLTILALADIGKLRRMAEHDLDPNANGFFFSSRRRHTSCLSDWSSDVCSSD